MARRKAEAHHGGAWKVAYADFVTAMMALFMVLWISAQDKKILLSTSRYFQNPFTSPLDKSSGVMPFDKNTETKETKTENDDPAGQKAAAAAPKLELAFLNSAASEFMKLLNLEAADPNRPLNIEVTSDGLRVTLYDRAKKPLFKGNTAEFTDWGRFLMQNLAWMVDQKHFQVVIEGHTSSNIAYADPNYAGWELSSDRANAARRALTTYAVDPAAIERVTGYADTKPLTGEDPADESNQRVTLSLSIGKKTAPATGPKVALFPSPQPENP
jgi:chemotaxis protein MotB